MHLTAMVLIARIDYAGTGPADDAVRSFLDVMPGTFGILIVAHET
jgi:hypothetical protein